MDGRCLSFGGANGFEVMAEDDFTVMAVDDFTVMAADSFTVMTALLAVDGRRRSWGKMGLSFFFF